jgi:hypothetical protein
MDDLSSTNATSASESDSLRADLEQAWEQATQPAEETTPETTDEVKTAEKVEETTDEEKVEETTAEATDEEKVDEEAKKETTVKAPQSWSPAMREKFAELPEEVRAEILKRESDVGKLAREGAQARQVAETFVSAIKPYEDVINEAGVSPVQAIQETFEMAKVLRKGSPRQKAEVLAQLTELYDIDVGELDTVLAERLSAPKPSKTERALLEKLNALEQKLTPSAAPVVQNQATDINKQVEEFAKDPKHEFFNDVAADMQTLLQMGKATDLQDAYDKAIRMNDEVQKVLTERKAKDKQRVTAGTSSLKGTTPKATPKVKNEDLSLRALLSKAYDETMGS